MEKAKTFGSPSQARYAGEQLIGDNPPKNTDISAEAKLGKKIVCQLNINKVAHFIMEEPVEASNG